MIWLFQAARPPQQLVQLLEDPSPEIRNKAFQELISHEDAQTDAFIIEAFQNSKSWPGESIQLLVEIIEKRKIIAGIPLLNSLLSEEDPRIRLSSVRALISIGFLQHFENLIPLLADQDPQIRSEIRRAFVTQREEKSSGFLIRALPGDHQSPQYFAIVSVLEDLGFFRKLKENLLHPDNAVKKFQFEIMKKFFRLEFIPHYLSFVNLENSIEIVELKNVLAEYPPRELYCAFRVAFSDNPSFQMLELASELLSGCTELFEDLIGLAKDIEREDFRLQFLEKTLKDDISISCPALFQLLDDPSKRIRNLVLDKLTSFYKSVQYQIKNKDEPNADYLKSLDQFRQRLLAYIEKLKSSEMFLALGRLIQEVILCHPTFLTPIIYKIVGEFFSETMNLLSNFPQVLFEDVFSGPLKNDRSLGELLVLQAKKFQMPMALAKFLLKYTDFLYDEDKEAFRKLLKSRLHFHKINDFFSDPDAKVRFFALDFIGENLTESLQSIIEDRTRDLSPEIRLKALKLALKCHHPHILKILERLSTDPSVEITLVALKSLKQNTDEKRFLAFLTRSVSHPTEAVRDYSLKEIAKITQERFIQNFQFLSPEVRKLAGSAMLKLDSSFTDRLIDELKVFDSEARFRAVRIIENLQATDKVREALLAAMRDPSQRVRAAIVKTLGVVGNSSILGSLVECLNDPDNRVRANTIEAISSIGDEGAIRILLPFLEDNNNRIRANAALAVWQISKMDIGFVLKNMLSSNDPSMRASSLWAMGEMRSPANIPQIIPFLKDANEMVRFNAVRSILKIDIEALKPYTPDLHADSSERIKRMARICDPK